MKIKVYKHIVMFLLPAALTGCSGKEDSLPGTGEAGLEIENCFSRSTGTDTGHVPVKDFGMVLLDETGGSYTGVSNPLHVTYGESWNFPQVTLTQKTCRLFAFSPFRSIPGKEVAVSLSPQTDYLASDEVRLDWQNRLASIENEAPALPSGLYRGRKPGVQPECGSRTYRGHIRPYRWYIVRKTGKRNYFFRHKHAAAPARQA